MIRMISGACRIGNAIFKPSIGDFYADEATEHRLVSLGVAEFVNSSIGSDYTSAEENKKDEPPVSESFAENDSDANTNEVEYSTESSVSQLRKLARENGIIFKAGMTKEEMLSELDAFFSDTPILSAEGPVE